MNQLYFRTIGRGLTEREGVCSSLSLSKENDFGFSVIPLRTALRRTEMLTTDLFKWVYLFTVKRACKHLCSSI